MRVIDNFLHKKDFKEIQEWILEPSCRWSYSPCVVDPNDEEDVDPAAYQFVNMIYYSRMGHENPDCVRIFTLLDKLRPQVLLKAKLNMQMMTDTIRVNDKHTDFTPSISCTTAIYYVNSNNGYSLIGDKKVESVENRIVLFNGKTLHAGTTCTDERRRLVLNLNFQGGPYDQTN